MLITRLPAPPLRPFVQMLWAVDASPPLSGARERVLPTGGMHLALRLTEQPLRLFEDADDATGHSVGIAVVGGVRVKPFFRDISAPAGSVGAMLVPGASEWLLGASEEELAGCHTPLDALWSGRAVRHALEQILERGKLERKLDMLECILVRRLAAAQKPDPVIADALLRFRSMESIDEVVRRSGYSHRYFIKRFRRVSGLTPKLYRRLKRFQRALQRMGTDSLGEIAIEEGYSDQSHFQREFLEFSGVTPAAYRRIGPTRPNHVPEPPKRD